MRPHHDQSINQDARALSPSKPVSPSKPIRSASRLLVLNGQRENFPLDDRLAALGYDVVADTASPEQVLSLAASVVPDGVLVVLDSLERASALITIRHLRERHPCAVIVLTGWCDTVDVEQLKAVRPHGVVQWPIADGILNASISAALAVAAEHRRQAQQPAAPAAVAAAPAREFEDFFSRAAARGARMNSTFAIGTVELSPSRAGADFPEQHDVVAEAAARLQEALRQTDVVLRRGHRKLVFLAEQVGPREIAAMGARIVRSIADPARRSAADAVAAVPSIGMALWKSADDAPEALMRAAEKALVEAKRAGQFRWRLAEDPEVRLSGKAYTVVPSAEPTAPLSTVQRLLGGLSLAALLWVLANYAGIGSSERVAEVMQRASQELHRLMSLWGG